MAWGAATLPRFWRELPVTQLAARITEGEQFRQADLLAHSPNLATIAQTWPCRGAALHSVAVIRLRLFEETVAAGEVAAIDERADAARESVRASLSCSPADSFLWLALFSLESARGGFKDEYLRYLRMSYQLGPHEGWVMLRRNRIALSIFERLPDDMAERAISEFVELVANRFSFAAADLLTGPGWRLHEKLLERIKDVAQRDREALAEALAVKGRDDVTVPGVKLKTREPGR